MLERFNVKYVGYVFVSISLYYIVHSLGSLDIDTVALRDNVSYKSLSYAFVSLSLYILVLYIGAMLWIFALGKLSGVEGLPIRSFLELYSKSNLAKYLPGNVLHYVARNVFAQKYSLSHKSVALASFFEISFILISGFSLLVLLDAFSLVNIDIDKYAQFIPSVDSVLASFLIALSFVLIIFVFRNKITSELKGFNVSVLGFHILGLLFTGYFLIYLMLGISQVLIMMIFSDIDLTFTNYCIVLFVFVFSWMIGFVMPGSPGGIGVREAVFIFLLSQVFAKEAVVFTAVFYRLLNVIGDLVFYLMSNKKLWLYKT